MQGLPLSQGGFALLFDESASFSAPIAFGTYRVLHQTGSGALGPVFRAFDPRQDRLVAVKAFKLDLLPEHVARFADALRRLAESPARHPALVATLDAGIEGATPFVVTPCQSGETLDVVMRRLPPLSLADALSYLMPVADAIDAAAQAGIDHGALHPRDVFVAAPGGAGDPPAGSIHVTGFGIARALESVNLLAETIRRPYAAPERSSGSWDVRADVYSLGVIAHELFTRCRPAAAGEQDGVFSPTLLPQQRVKVRKVLAAAIAEDPSQRYATAGQFVAALQAIASREAAALPVPAPSTSAVATSTTAAVVSPQGVLDLAPVTVIDDAAALLAFVAETAPPPATIAEVEPVTEPAASAVHADAAVLAPHDPGAIELRRVPPVAAPVARPGHRRSRQVSHRSLVAAMAVVAVAVGAFGAYIAGSYRPAPRVVKAAGVSDGVANEDAAVGDVGTARPALPGVAEPADDDVQIKPAAPMAARDVRRVSAPAAGRLVIRSEPSGALVTVDGRSWGATPTTVRDLSLGTHAVRVARPGHVPRFEQVTLRSAAPTQTLTFALEPGLATDMPALGAIDVDSRPRSARVIVDGRFVGQAPLRIPQLRPGTYAVTLELDGYTSLTSRVTVEAGKSAALRPALRSTN